MSDLGPDVPLPVGAFIRQSISEGLGVTAARGLMREQGIGAMSNAAFGELYGQVRAALGNRDVIAGLDYNAVPSADVFTPWAAGEPDRYSSFVEVFVREVGTRAVTSRFYTYTTEGAHTPQEAADAAVDVIGDGSEDGTTPSGEVILFPLVTSMTRTVRRAS